MPTQTIRLIHPDTGEIAEITPSAIDQHLLYLFIKMGYRPIEPDEIPVTSARGRALLDGRI